MACYFGGKPKAQSFIEYAVLLIVVISALVIMHSYVRSAFQGRMREASDELGMQYEPGVTSIRHTVVITTEANEFRKTFNLNGQTATIPITSSESEIRENRIESTPFTSSESEIRENRVESTPYAE